MAILTEEVQEMQGFTKEIEQSSMTLILDNLQRYQYQYPQKSTIRELACNAIDAITEKNVALGILSGKLKKEDYYLERDGEMYRDSNFDPGYYDPKWLSTGRSDLHDEMWKRDTDKVYITYQDGGDTDKDRIIIEDYGVGLGGRRLERYFHLGLMN